jgi:hypothetical protein
VCSSDLIYVQSRGKLVVSRGAVMRVDLQNQYGIYGSVSSGQVVNLGEIEVNTINEEGKRLIVQGLLNYGRVTVIGWMQLSDSNKQFENAWIGGTGNLTLPSGDFTFDGEIEMSGGGWFIIKGGHLNVPRVASIKGNVLWLSGQIDADNPDCVASNPQQLPISPCTLSTLYNEGLMLATCKNSYCYFYSGIRFVNQGTFQYTQGGYFYLYSDVENKGLVELSNADAESTSYEMRRYSGSVIRNMAGGEVVVSSPQGNGRDTRIEVPIVNEGGDVRYVTGTPIERDSDDEVQRSYVACLTQESGSTWLDAGVEVDGGCSESVVSGGNFSGSGLWKDNFGCEGGCVVQPMGDLNFGSNARFGDGSTMRLNFFDEPGNSDRVVIEGTLSTTGVVAVVAVAEAGATFDTGDEYGLVQYASFTGALSLARDGFVGGGLAVASTGNATLTF